MSLLKLLATLFSLVERFFQSRHDDKMRQEGAEAVERTRAETRDAVRREADKVRSRAPVRDKRDVLGRM